MCLGRRRVPRGISAVCISALPHMEIRKIKKFHVFIFTCTASVFSYLRHSLSLFVLRVNSGGCWWFSPESLQIGWKSGKAAAHSVADGSRGAVTLFFFFIFLGVAFMLDKSFSGEDDPDVLEVHRQLEARFGQPVAIEGVRAMLMKPVYAHDCRNSRVEAKGQLLRLSTGSKKPALHVYGFTECEAVIHHDSLVTLRVKAAPPHPSPVRIKYRTQNGMAKAGERWGFELDVL